MAVLFKASKQTLQYEVNFETYNKSAKISQNTLNYICEVRQIGETLRGYAVNFKRHNISLNNTKIHDPMNEIALVAGELLHDLDLEVSDYGKILKIKNLKAILEKWQRIKFKLEYTYLGDIVKSIIEKLDKTVLDEKCFIDSLHKDPFFYNFLCNVYGDYPNDKLAFEKQVKNFAGIKNISINKNYAVERTENKGQIVRGKANLTEDEKDKIKEEKKVQEVEFSLDSTHQLSPQKYMIQIDSNQRLIIDGKLSASQKVRIEIKNV